MTIVTQKIPLGYKQTEVGVIPVDWDVKKFSEVTSLITCGIAATPKYVAEGRGYPFLSSTNIKEGKIIWNNFKYITLELHRMLYRNNPPKKGDILYSRVGTIGEAAVIEENFEFSIYVSLTLIKTKSVLNSYFLMHLLNSIPYKRRAKDQVYLGGGVGNLNVEVVRDYPIPVPTIKEQFAIATVLSDADALIEHLEKVIAKKKAIKEGTMQRLLTGKTRLPGFSGAWELKKLGEIGSFSKGRGIRKDQSQSGELPCIRYGELYTRHNNYIKQYYSFISKEVAITAKKLSVGDILFAGSGETKEEIGKCAAFIDGIEAYAGGDIVIFSPLSTDSLFLGYLLNSPIAVKQKASKGQGDAVVHISASNLKEVQIPIPPTKSEQTAIATILSDMDAEIESLEQKRDKYTMLKQGMMQQLLTGRIRIDANN